jgi:ketosteroid isomerase-like protein
VDAELEQLVERIFAAFTSRDVAGVLELSDPDVEFLPITATLAGTGMPYRGHDGIARYFMDVERWWGDLTIHPQEYRQIGRDRMLVLGTVEATRGGVTRHSSAGWVWRFRNGVLVSGRVYASAEEALAAVS